MIENDRARKRRFSDAIRLYDAYLFILNRKSSSKKRQLTPSKKKLPLDSLNHRSPRSISSPSKHRKQLKEMFR